MKKLKDKIKETWDDSPALTILSAAAVIGSTALLIKSSAELVNSSASIVNAVNSLKAEKFYRERAKKRDQNIGVMELVAK